MKGKPPLFLKIALFCFIMTFLHTSCGHHISACTHSEHLIGGTAEREREEYLEKSSMETADLKL